MPSELNADDYKFARDIKHAITKVMAYREFWDLNGEIVNIEDIFYFSDLIRFFCLDFSAIAIG